MQDIDLDFHGIDRTELDISLKSLYYFENYLNRIQKKWPDMFVEVVRMNNTRLFEHMNGEMIDLLFTLEEELLLARPVLLEI